MPCSSGRDGAATAAFFRTFAETGGVDIPGHALEDMRRLFKGQAVEGRYHTYPEMAAAGLWTTPSDLALFVLALSHAHQQDKDAILGPEMAKAMFTPQFGGFGLGIILNGKDRSLSFSHNGANAGFRSYFIGFPATGQGAVLMANSDNGDQVISEFTENLRAEYRWPG